MIPPGGAPPVDLDPWDDAPSLDPNLAIWRERERRQRTIRVVMMFLLMLLLMDGDENNNNTNKRAHQLRKRIKRKGSTQLKLLEPHVFSSRQVQDKRIREIATAHPRYQALIHKNGDKNVELEIMKWAAEKAEQEKDEFVQDSTTTNILPMEERDPEEDRKVFTYPWNTTGFYRGTWSRKTNVKNDPEETSDKETPEHVKKEKVNEPEKVEHLDAVALEQPMMEVLERRKKQIGVFILPKGKEIMVRDDHNYTSMKWESMTVDSNGKMYQPIQAEKEDPKITLEHDSGRAAFQLYSRSIPAMKEISLVDGFVKLYDSSSQGYSTRKDILLRVRGVLIHAIGRISLVSNVDVGKSALVIANERAAETKSSSRRRRRLEEALSNVKDASIEDIRDDALALFSDKVSTEKFEWAISSPDLSSRRLSDEPETQKEVNNHFDVRPEEDDAGTKNEDEKTRKSYVSVAETYSAANTASLEKSTLKSSEKTPKKVERGGTTGMIAQDARRTQETKESDSSPWSDVVIPFPFVRDDKDESIRQVKTPAARRMPAREQLLEANAAACAFEVNLDVEEVEWTVGAWRTLLGRKAMEAKLLNPAMKTAVPDAKEAEITRSSRLGQPTRTKSKPIQDEALVINMVGSIHSSNCEFSAMLNATAQRTDWDATTSKAINYSFYMMLVCLAQIMILLRQLLHSQAQSTAVRVSLLCIGWQTVADALVCLGHIYLSLAMQPLFTAFASVAFFKLLIFCVIEMKYMSLIIQARNSSNGGQPTEVLRRQVAMLHLRFYVALFVMFVLLFYIGDKYRILYALALYSFWVPQIVMNVITEAKTPLHKYYIYGMSVTRLFAPLYIFAVPNNFLKEVYPDAPTDHLMCQLLVLWVGIQTAVLVAQGKYGARFMIPARFLPPKFDYSRPLPASMLPPGALEMHSSSDSDESSRSYGSETQALVSSESSPSSPTRARHTTSVTTRNRMRGNRVNRAESGMTTERVSDSPSPLGHHTLDCSICYEGIDVRDRRGYMLAPCDHLFHRDCLVQWMDVKMMCPICRTELPAL